MYPIEREDYVNAYIGAMTEEIQRSKLRKSIEPESTGSIDRLYRAVANRLGNWSRGAGVTARSSPTH